jgi:hypothetical protein
MMIKNVEFSRNVLCKGWRVANGKMGAEQSRRRANNNN